MVNLYKECQVLTATHRHPGHEIRPTTLANLRRKIGFRTRLKKITRQNRLKKDFTAWLEEKR